METNGCPTQGTEESGVAIKKHCLKKDMNETLKVIIGSRQQNEYSIWPLCLKINSDLR